MHTLQSLTGIYRFLKENWHTGFGGSFFVVKQGIPCLYYMILLDLNTLTFMHTLNEFPCKLALLQGKACNDKWKTNVMLAVSFYVAIVTMH